MDGGYGSVTIVHDARSPEDVFQDFCGRRSGIVKALTIEVEKFYKQCDPEKENLCLYGLPNGTWAVTLPADEVPPELPEPALGINFARDGMQEKDWLSLIAVHSDSWLLSVAFYFGARFGFDKKARERLFMMTSSLPTVFEVVSGGVNTQSKTANGSSKNKSGSKPPKRPNSDSKPQRQVQAKYEEENGGRGNGGDEDQAETICGACGEAYANGEFWICCDICETWFHGKCVRITPAKAEHIKHYKCPGCSNKRTRE
uniref:PHD finger protein ALFIN-LIKE n=2 Tax=Oryza TaxID=4527 RepID=A0A0E0H1D7_ORYNI|nr:OSIGBa0140O07.1 [Oryza sativa]